ncbi:MAG: hypothetical protein ACK5LC_16270 [Coprobacillaceae bacterium]
MNMLKDSMNKGIVVVGLAVAILLGIGYIINTNNAVYAEGKNSPELKQETTIEPLDTTNSSIEKDTGEGIEINVTDADLEKEYSTIIESVDGVNRHSFDDGKTWIDGLPEGVEVK